MSSESLKALADVCDRVLIEGLPPNLKEAIDRLLSAGVPAEKVKSICRRATKGDSLLYLGVASYLDERRKP